MALFLTDAASTAKDTGLGAVYFAMAVEIVSMGGIGMKKGRMDRLTLLHHN